MEEFDDGRSQVMRSGGTNRASGRHSVHGDNRHPPGVLDFQNLETKMMGAIGKKSFSSVDPISYAKRFMNFMSNSLSRIVIMIQSILN